MQEHETPSVSREDLIALQERLGVRFSDPELLRTAVTHRSYLGETQGFESNERLEFLGDSVLGLVIAEYLFQKLQGQAEGYLSKAKAVVVSEPTLAEASRSVRLQECMLLSTGENLSGGRERASILADMFEAIVAVIYLDQGLEAAREFILRVLARPLAGVESGEHITDYKSQLQQIVQSRSKVPPRYVVVEEWGADHDKTFVIEVQIGGKPSGRGQGKSKKQAEQAAAKEALQLGLLLGEESR